VLKAITPPLGPPVVARLPNAFAGGRGHDDDGERSHGDVLRARATIDAGFGAVHSRPRRDAASSPSAAVSGGWRSCARAVVED